MGFLDQEIELVGVDHPSLWAGNDDDDNGRVTPVEPPVRDSAAVEAKQPKAPPKPKLVKVQDTAEPEPEPEPEPKENDDADAPEAPETEVK